MVCLSHLINAHWQFLLRLGHFRLAHDRGVAIGVIKLKTLAQVPSIRERRKTRDSSTHRMQLSRGSSPWSSRSTGKVRLVHTVCGVHLDPHRNHQENPSRTSISRSPFCSFVRSRRYAGPRQLRLGVRIKPELIAERRVVVTVRKHDQTSGLASGAPRPPPASRDKPQSRGAFYGG
jgi:hypothetical protein